MGRVHSHRRRDPTRAGDLVSRALKGFGIPSRRVNERLVRAWAATADPHWASRTELKQIEGGVLKIAVHSAPLRDELANFHGERLLQVLRTALPDVPLIGLHFILGAPGSSAQEQDDA